jgi:hypothetical protein
VLLEQLMVLAVCCIWSMASSMDEVLDVAAIERRDEAPPHRDEHLARDIVGVLLAIHHRLAVAVDGIATLQHVTQRLGAGGNDVGMLCKEIEEPLLARA